MLLTFSEEVRLLSRIGKKKFPFCILNTQQLDIGIHFKFNKNQNIIRISFHVYRHVVATKKRLTFTFHKLETLPFQTEKLHQEAFSLLQKQ